MTKPLSWLEEVKADAAFNYHRRLREQQEKQAYEEAKKKGLPLQEFVATDVEDEVVEVETTVAPLEPVVKKGK